MPAPKKPKRPSPARTIAFQGKLGAYSHLACGKFFPEMDPLPTASFEDTFSAVVQQKAEYAMIPIENSVAGRVADIHRIMPESGLYIIGERFLPVNHSLLAPNGATLNTIQRVHSHVHALGQCGRFIRKYKLEPIIHADTAGAAADIAVTGGTSDAAIASELAGKVYGLKSIRENIEDAEHNTTRFVVMARDAFAPKGHDGPVVTSFIFRVRNVPAALFKALGGFATNGINMTKIESYMVGGDFFATQFYADVEGGPGDLNFRLAMEELDFYTHEVRVLGTYPADPFRHQG